ncbi:YdeI/OmpD-associated family protein [Botrimarina sp.]|uniref:YdeI/OmpD-associated family protein n=1 Tax=Botrimarina sp. TaxID=2795802 RepID=UPI0032EF0ADA
MAAAAYEFEAPIVARSFDTFRYTVVFLPDATRRSVPFPDGRPLRIDAEVNGVPLSGALMPHKKGRYLLLSKRFLKRLRCEAGDRVFVRFSVADQDRVDVPIELERALEASSRLKKLWNELTPGRRRGLAYRVGSAKRPDTRRRRVEQVLEEIAGGAP